MPRRIRYTRERFRRERNLWASLIERVTAPAARRQVRRMRVYGQNSNLESFTARWARAA